MTMDLWAITKRVAFYALVLFIVVVAVFPFYYAILTSFKSGTALFQINYWPTSFSLNNYFNVLNTGSFPRNLLNSVFISAVTVLLAFIGAWNEFLFALTFTANNETRTVPVAIALLSGSTQYEIPWGNIMAASVIVTVPLVVLVLIFQRKIVSGLTAGGVKG